jgi:hypothetical protein
MRSALSAILAIALLAGCGHSQPKALTHAQPDAALDAIVYSPTLQRADREFMELAAGMPSAACPVEARAFADDTDDLVESVAELRPPPDAENLQRLFVPSARRTAHLLDRLADDVAAGRVACGRPWNRRAYGLRSTVAAERALRAFAPRGYLLPWKSGDRGVVPEIR